MVVIGQSEGVDGTRQTAEAPITTVRATPGRWLLCHRYFLLATLVTVLSWIQTANGQWSSDMWEHVAVVRELIDDPFRETPPLVLLDTPYTVTLGVLGHVFGISATSMLSLAAAVNVVLLVVALRLFVIEATQNRQAPFWVLLFLLLLWGLSPYRFSGFFNLNSIGFVLPYPSAFATAIALFTLAAALRAARNRHWALFLAVAGGTATVVLVHPITGAWLALGLLAVGISRAREIHDWVWLMAAAAVAFALTLLWPYYSIFDLLSDTGRYDASNKAMYDDVVPRLFPAVIGLWAIWRRFRVDRRDVLGIMLVGGLAIYAYGYLRNQYSFGRSLAFIVLVLAVAAGDGVAKVENSFRWDRASAWRRTGAVALGALLVLGLVESRGGLVRMVPAVLLPTSVRTSDEFVRLDDKYGFLERYIDGGDGVVAATKQDSKVIPAIAGQPLRPYWMAPVVSDFAARAAAQAEFLDPITPAARRSEIAAKYNARFVLLHRRGRTTASLVQVLESSGARVVYDRGDFKLVALARPRETGLSRASQ
jgi:hypothetical protein